jgi:hypothetical protein
LTSLIILAQVLLKISDFKDMAGSSEMPLVVYQAARRHISEVSDLHRHRGSDPISTYYDVVTMKLHN